jgi:CheY-like chemotaxis protein
MDSDSASLLIVEDEPFVAMSLVEVLEEGGYQVSVCSTGFDALNYIEMEDGLLGIVTDIRLGEGPDGWEIARRAREHFPAAHVIYITGDSANEFLSEAVPRSVLLQKPFPLQKFVSAISALLH